jgi:hypothetical protein
MFGSDGLKQHPENILKSIVMREPSLNELLLKATVIVEPGVL